MNRYAEMQVFVRSAEDGSFSAAARNLGLTPSAVSKLVSRLEDRLGVLLFRRAHRNIVLTSEGHAYYQASLAAIEAVETADTVVFSGTVARETLRVRSMPIFGQAALAPKIPEFCRQHPNLRLEIQLRIDPGPLLDDGTDVAIHVGPLKDSSLVATRFCSARWIICASPDYLSRHGSPAEPIDLLHHNCLNFVSTIPASVWTVRTDDDPLKPIAVHGQVLSNQASILLELARAGLGIVRLNELQIHNDLAQGRLIEIFPKYQSYEEDPVYAVYQSRRHVNNRVRMFLDFLRVAFADPPPWQHWRTRESAI